MPTFSWKGKNKMGKTQEGVISADNKDVVIAMLRRQQIMVSGVTEKGKELSFPKFGAASARRRSPSSRGSSRS